MTPRHRKQQPPSDAARSDQGDAQRERAARRLILDLGADALAARPWQPRPVPPSAIDLVQYALWRSSGSDPDALRGALALLAAARAELDQLETGLLFAARSAELTWAQIADAMGANSPQASQQRFHRLLARGEAP